jgi:hypothetical protein
MSKRPNLSLVKLGTEERDLARKRLQALPGWPYYRKEHGKNVGQMSSEELQEALETLDPGSILRIKREVQAGRVSLPEIRDAVEHAMASQDTLESIVARIVDMRLDKVLNERVAALVEKMGRDARTKPGGKDVL